MTPKSSLSLYGLSCQIGCCWSDGRSVQGESSQKNGHSKVTQRHQKSLGSNRYLWLPLSNPWYLYGPPNLYRFWQNQRYWSKNTMFVVCTPCNLISLLMDYCQNSVTVFWLENYNSPARWHSDTCSCFDTVLMCDRQTDGQTDWPTERERELTQLLQASVMLTDEKQQMYTSSRTFNLASYCRFIDADVWRSAAASFFVDATRDDASLFFWRSSLSWDLRDSTVVENWLTHPAMPAMSLLWFVVHRATSLATQSNTIITTSSFIPQHLMLWKHNYYH